MPTSKLSHGLIRHMAEDQRNWFHRILLRKPGLPGLWIDPAVDDSELAPVDDADWRAEVAAWQAGCEHSRAAAARHGLDDTGLRRGEPCSLRWIYTHLVEEYARHNGHAGLIRRLVDGVVDC